MRRGRKLGAAITLALPLMLARTGTAQTWSFTGGGSWSVPGNWLGGVPNASNAEAILGGAITAASTVLADIDVDLNSLVFNHNGTTPQTYTVDAAIGKKLRLSGTNNRITLASTNNANHTISSPIAISNSDLTISLNCRKELQLSGSISEDTTARKLIINGVGTIHLAAANNHTGGTELTGVTCRIEENSGFGGAASSLTMNGASLEKYNPSGGTLTLTRSIVLGANGGTFSTNTHALVLDGVISGTGPMKVGTGNAVHVRGQNTFTGTVTIGDDVFGGGGEMAVNSDSAFGNIANEIRLSLNGSLAVLNDFTSARALKLNGSAQINTGDNDLTWSGVISQLSNNSRLDKKGSGQLTLSGDNTYSGGTRITAGVLSVSADKNLGNAAGSVTLETAGTLQATDSFTTNRLFKIDTPPGGKVDVAQGKTLTCTGEISGDGKLVNKGKGMLEVKKVKTGGLDLLDGQMRFLAQGGTSRVNELTIAPAAGPGFAATLDIGNNAMVVDYDPLDPSPHPQIELAVRSGYQSGSWTGTGINSSVAAGSLACAVGYAEATDVGVGTFLGEPVDQSAVLVRFTLKGDSNLDGSVGSPDFAALAIHFGLSGQSWSDGDFNYDASVNSLDFNVLAAAFGTTLSSPGANVPEPGLLPLTAASAMVLARRRRQ